MNSYLVLIAAVLYAVSNGTAFVMYWADKRRAVENRYRIRESTLLTAALFGPFGAFAGMRRFRHKTRKTKFNLVYLLVMLHAALILFLVREFFV
ncbi:MAG: DUF1294 domain-containing protein [Candidatus Methanoplasma sp.]|jgi:uncharacterized membrane protein YsdA (DUF1294 family)|nr:DUF1294 domain-containing protein [Candidatus Methanoplasma sp.]